jgi:hypothetical protein
MGENSNINDGVGSNPPEDRAAVLAVAIDIRVSLIAPLIYLFQLV